MDTDGKRDDVSIFERIIGSTDAAKSLGQLLSTIKNTNQTYYIARNNVPEVAVVPIKTYEHLLAIEEKYRHIIESK